MTLIEVMLTLVIVSILTVAALRVTIDISRAQGLEQRLDSDSALESRLDELLRMDVGHADGCRRTSEGLELRCLSAIDYKSLELGHLPVTVRYEVRKSGGISWLVRRQEYQGKVFNELVCSGVSAVGMGAAGATGGKDADDVDKFAKMPQAVTIVVKFDRPGASPLEFTYHTK